MEKQLQVGVISSTHGVRGEVKVFPTTDDVTRFRQLKKVYLDTGREMLPLEIQNVKFFKQFAILKFKGIDNINDIEKYRGKSLMIDREDAVDVMETGANDVYIIDSPEYGEVLIPAIRECILDVDMDEDRMTIHLMEGLV